jgi:predicted transcriptional regulator
MKKINQGLKDAETGRLVEKGSFAEFADDAE